MKTTRLSPLYEAEGPFATVLLDVSHDTEHGAHEHELRVREACEALTDLGADAVVIEHVESHLGERLPDPAPVSRFVVATKEGVVFADTLHRRVDSPVVSWSQLPDLAAWVAHHDALTAFVLAVVDHAGGDVGTYDSDVPEPHDDATVGGETHHVHKVPTGGWSALRYQNVVENVWQRNADVVADAIESHVRAGYPLVLLAGNPQSMAKVMERMSGSRAEVVQLASGSRADDGGDEALQQAIREALMDHATRRRLELASSLTDRLGRGSGVATGVRDVADAFVRGQVETLVLDPAEAAALTLTPRDHPGLVLGTAPDDQPLPADQALIAAAALTGADVVVSSRSVMAGTPVAALLRWDSSTGE
jgi:Bacterial archaeo-eukaryotic release factor family 2